MIEQFQHVFVSLAMARAGNVRVRQFIHDGNGGLTRNDCVQIHLFKDAAAILDFPERHALQIADQRRRLRATMRLDEGNDNVHALLFQQARVFKHLTGLADTRRCADVNAQFRPLVFAEPGKQRFGRWPAVVVLHLLLRFTAALSQPL